MTSISLTGTLILGHLLTAKQTNTVLMEITQTVFKEDKTIIMHQDQAQLQVQLLLLQVNLRGFQNNLQILTPRIQMWYVHGHIEGQHNGQVAVKTPEV